MMMLDFFFFRHIFLRFGAFKVLDFCSIFFWHFCLRFLTGWHFFQPFFLHILTYFFNVFPAYFFTLFDFSFRSSQRFSFTLFFLTKPICIWALKNLLWATLPRPDKWKKKYLTLNPEQTSSGLAYINHVEK